MLVVKWPQETGVELKESLALKLAILLSAWYPGHGDSGCLMFTKVQEGPP